MREMLETFRLPGESQQISRITETFSEIYFASGPGMSYTWVGRHVYWDLFQRKWNRKMLYMFLRSPSLCWIPIYTVPRSGQVLSITHLDWVWLTFTQKRMTTEEYMRNLRGVNDGSDFSTEYLVRLQILCNSSPLTSILLARGLRKYPKTGNCHARGTYRSIRFRVRVERATRPYTNGR